MPKRRHPYPCSWGFYLIAALLSVASIVRAAVPNPPAEADDPILLEFTSVPIRTGAYSIFSDFQLKLADALEECGETLAARVTRHETGVFGAGTASAIRTLIACPGFRSLASSPAVVRGALSVRVWSAVTGTAALPSLRDRIGALTLTFEATDFGKNPEWNFCQDSADPLAVAAAASKGAPVQCYNATDPCSLLTWGPRGATAGQGREIQWILHNAIRVAPSLVKKAFGREYPNVLLFIRLNGPPAGLCDGSSALEHFMCTVWIDHDRRTTWDRALATLGKSTTIRSIFGQVYDLDEFDGYKIKAYYALWIAAGIQPSEIDFAYFHDRTTHIGAPSETMTVDDLKACVEVEREAASRNAAARRCLSKLHPHATQPRDRKGRDVSFYADGYTRQALLADELKIWDEHIPISAHKTFGLSDDATVPLDEALGSLQSGIVAPAFDQDDLTRAEHSCPEPILKPMRSLSSRRPAR